MGAGRSTGAPDSPADLRRVVEDAAPRLEGRDPLTVLGWAVRTFGRRFCVASSMQDGLLAHLASEIRPGIPVLFVDTDFHFPETLMTFAGVQATTAVSVRRVRPALSVADQDSRYGEQLHRTNPDLCCALRKVAPFESALRDFDAWATGARRDQSQQRAHLPVVSWDAARNKVKVAPLATWTQHDVDRYVREHHVVANPLRRRGYPSVGCWPCTRPVAHDADPRSGRWAGSPKTECGLNL